MTLVQTFHQSHLINALLIYLKCRDMSVTETSVKSGADV